MSVAEARSYFPRGLEQPEGGYRFSVDSLLLGCFAGLKRGWRGVDLGCGAGAVSMAALLANADRDIQLTGLELDGDAAACAVRNAGKLGFSSAFDVVQGDVSGWRGVEQQMHFALMNPPFREPSRGRQSQGAARRQARFESAGSLADFVRTAALSLKSRGRLFTVFLPERMEALFRELDRNRLAPKRLLMVHGKRAAEARILLMEAVKSGGEGLRVLPPLILYNKDGALTEEAVTFCPYLGCNARENI